jgi:biopolymer transport protein ExbB
MCRIAKKHLISGLIGAFFIMASAEALAQTPPAPAPAGTAEVAPVPSPAAVKPAPAPAAVTPAVAPAPAAVTPAVAPAPAAVTPAPVAVTPAPAPAPVTPAVVAEVAPAGEVADLEPGAKKSEPVKTEMTISDYLQTGGWLLYALAAMSVVGLSFVVYFLFVFTRRNVAPQDFVKDVQMMLSYNRMNEARKACEKSRSPVASIAVAGIDYVEKTDNPDPVLLKEILEGEGGRQAATIQTQITYLLDIGVIAPMVGLLGTVFGMLHSFGALALDLTSAKPVELAGGITEALVTTAGGLIVGIPAMLAYAFFRGRASGLISSMELAANEFLVALVGRKR